MKAVLLLFALAVATSSAAFAASRGVAHSQPREPVLTYYSSAGSAAAVPVVPEVNDANVRGATGRTIVPGSNSTVTGGSSATMNQRMGAYSGGN
jgi:hypothetical protein